MVASSIRTTYILAYILLCSHPAAEMRDLSLDHGLFILLFRLIRSAKVGFVPIDQETKTDLNCVGSTVTSAQPGIRPQTARHSALANDVAYITPNIPHA